MSLSDVFKLRKKPGSGAVGAISNTDARGAEVQRYAGDVIAADPADRLVMETHWPVAMTSADPSPDSAESIALINGETKLNPFERHDSDDPEILWRLFRLKT